MKEKLFGAARLLEVTGNNKPDPEKLKKPLPAGGYGTWFHCDGCGTYEPVLREAVPEIVGQERPSYNDHYIATDRCDHCLGQGFENARLEPIPEKE